MCVHRLLKHSRSPPFYINFISAMIALVGVLLSLAGGIYVFLASLRTLQRPSQVPLRASLLVLALRIFFDRASSFGQVVFWTRVVTRPYAFLLQTASYFDGMCYKKVELNVSRRLEVSLSCDPKDARAETADHICRKIKAEWVMTAQNWHEGSRFNVALFFHGGFFVSLDSISYRPLTRRLAKLGFSVLSVNQRLQPANSLVDTLHDACVAYQWLLQDIAVPPECIMLIGEGTGANLALQLLSACEEKNLPVPGGICLLSPFFEWASKLPSEDRNEDFDYLGLLKNKNLSLSSVLVESFRGSNTIDEILEMPLMDISRETPSIPMLIQSSTMSQLADGTERFLARQRLSKAHIEHDVLMGMPHGAHMLSQFVKLTSGNSIGVAFERIWEWWARSRHRASPGIQKTLIAQNGSTKKVLVRPPKPVDGAK